MDIATETSANERPANNGADTVLSDMSPLVDRVHRLIETHHAQVANWTIEDFDLTAFARATGFTARRKGKPEIVLGADIAAELGHPATASQAFVLTTTKKGVIHNNRVSLLGPDLDQMAHGQQRPFGQVVMLALRPNAAPDPFELEGAQFLINRLPGYMVRSVPGRLWVRISRQGRVSGLTLQTVARALISAYREDFPNVVGIEVFFVTSSADDVEALAPIALEASVVAGRHKKLVLSSDGELECAELSCETCDEKPVCDDLRDILRQRRRKK